MQLTAKKIKELEPQAKRYIVRDESQKGLCVRVSPTGRKTFIVDVKHNGQNIKKTIGTTDVWGLPAARDKAKEIVWKLHSMGEFPDIKMSELFEFHISRQRKRPLAKKTVTNYRQSWNSLPHAIRKRKASELTKHMVRNWYWQKKDAAPVAANRTVALLSAMLSTAVSYDKIPSNPLDGFKLESEDPNVECATLRELDSLFSTLLTSTFNKYPYHIIPILMTFTGTRMETLTQMKWSQIEGDVWTTPPTKNGMSYKVVLHPTVQSLLAKISNDSEWVFPSRLGGYINANSVGKLYKKHSGITKYTAASWKKVFVSVAEGHTGHMGELKALCQHSIVGDVTIDHYYRPSIERTRELIGLIGDSLNSNLSDETRAMMVGHFLS